MFSESRTYAHVCRVARPAPRAGCVEFEMIAIKRFKFTDLRSASDFNFILNLSLASPLAAPPRRTAERSAANTAFQLKIYAIFNGKFAFATGY